MSLSKTKHYTLNPRPLLKIGQAANALGVSIDTLRRWEKAGKIQAIRTPGGTRLYSLATLKKLNPASIEDFQAKSLTTEELLKRAEDKLDVRSWKLDDQTSNIQLQDPTSNLQHPTSIITKSLVNKFLIGTAVLSAVTLLITAWITASYLTTPKEAKQFFAGNIAAPLFKPFNKLAEEMVAVISPKKAQELGFVPKEEQPPPLYPTPLPLNPNVLAVTSITPFLEINSDTQINGALFVRDQINNLSLEGTPSASTITLSSGETTLTVSNDATLDQDVSTASTPAFNFLNLSATSNQLVFQSGGPSGTLTWTPTAARIITLPDATTTLVGKDTTDTLKNKSISGSDNTLTAIPNSALSNNKVTVTAGTNLTGGGDVTLGSSVTISLKTSPAISGVLSLADGTAAAPSLTFSDDTDTGLYRIGSNKIGLITGGSATSGITIDGSGNVGIGNITPSATLYVSGNVGIGFTGTSSAVPGLGLAVAGNVGIGTTTAASALTVAGGTSIGQNYGGITAPSNGLIVQGNVGVGTSAPQTTLDINGDAIIRGSLTQTGVFLAPDGSASAPAYSFSADTDSGLWRIGANQIALTTAGGAMNGLAINSNGNVGIGTTDAGARLIVTGGNVGIGFTSPDRVVQIASDIDITSSNASLLGAAGTQFSITGGSSTGLTKKLVLGIDTTDNYGVIQAGTSGTNYSLSLNPAGGNVGIGNDNPQAKLHIGNNDAAHTIRVDGTGGKYITINSDDTSIDTSGNPLLIKSGGYTVIGTSGENSNVGIGVASPVGLLQVGAAPTSALFVTSAAGNVGIGTTGPGTKLDVVGTGRFSSTLAVTGVTTLSANNAALSFTGSTPSLTSGSSVFGLFAGGNVGIGTTGNIYGGLTVRGAGTSTGITLQTYGSNLTQGLTALDNGNVGIGTTGPGANLSVSSNATIGFGGATSIAGPSNGLAVSGSVGIGTTSPNWNVHLRGNDNADVALAVDNINTGNSAQAKVIIRSGSNSNSILQFRDQDATRWDFLVDSSDLMKWNYTGSNTMMVLDTSGNLGIGFTSPTSLLHLLQTGSANAFRVDDQANDTSPFIIASDGNVGIANSAPSYALDVVGATRFSTNITQGAGQFLAADGSSSLPAYSFSGDTDTGLWRIGSNQIALTTGGAAMSGLSINSSGNIGIGTTNASNTLHVIGGGAVQLPGIASLTANTTVNSAPTGTTITVPADASNTSTYTGATLRIDTPGILLGGASTTYTNAGTITQTGLAITQGGLDGNNSLQGNPVTFTGINISGSSQTSRFQAQTWKGLSMTTPSNADTASGSWLNATTALDVTLGTVNGLGTSTQTGLSITGGTQTSGTQRGIYVSMSATTHQALYVNQGISYFGGNVGIGNTNPAGSLIVQSGNVGIGHTLPTANLHVLNTASQDSFRVDDVANDTSPFVINLDGNVGISNSAPSYALDVVGTGRISSLLNVLGNVGIGTSGVAGAALQVNGGGLFGWGTASTALSSGAIAGFNGNVGVGTTSPLGALHVVGQCVAEGTRIRRRRRNKFGEWIEEDIPVEDIKPDDEVLSLNDKTGEWEWHRVEKTMDMGIQEVFRLETESGKWIETTAEHPYLVTEGALFNESQIDIESKQQSKHHQAKSNGSFDINIFNINTLVFNTHSRLLNNAETNNATIPNPILIVNAQNLNLGLFVTSGTINAAPNQPADRLTNRSDNVVSQTFSIPSILPYQPNQSKWIKVKNLKVGQLIATADGWEKISSIYPTDRKQTYDLQIEGTHNFVGNDIVAHNTYINGSTGLGAAFVNTTTPANGLAVSGNVGIGTTTANSNLSVAGNAHIGALYQGIAAPANGLFVDGSVGIGATTSSNKLDVWGNSRLAGTLAVDSNTTIGGTLGVTGVTTLSSTLSVSGVSTLSANNAALSFTGTTPSLTSGSSVFGLFAGGNVGIGTTGNVYGGLTVRGAGTSTGITLQTYGSNLTQGLTVLDNGNVGIGTTNPAYKLHIVDASDDSTEAMRIVGGQGGEDFIKFERAGSRTWAINLGGSWFNIRDTTSSTQRLSIDTNGNVGLSNIAPYARLHASGAGTTTGLSLLTTDSAGTQRFAVLDNGNVGIGTTNPGGSLIVNSGNVGIANSAPSYALDVIGATRFSTNITQGAGQFLASDGTASLPAYSFSGDTDSGLWRIGANQIALTTAGAAMSGLAINSSGNVGIGNTSASAKLQLIGSGTGTGLTFFTTDSANTPRFSILDNGNVGIGTSVPNSLLQVVSDDSTNSTISVSLANDGSQAPSFLGRKARGTHANPAAASNGDTIATFGGSAYNGSAYGQVGYIQLRVDGTYTSGQRPPSLMAFTTNVADDGQREHMRIAGSGDIFLANINSSLANATMYVGNGGSVGVGTTGPGAKFIVTGGNVGIGTSAAGAALQVNGGGLFGWGTASTALSSGAIAGFNGNVGVGTTSPLGALHVVGQCVTGDTKLRRRRRKNTSDGEHEVDSSEVDEIWEEVRIDQIQAGDEILTLDEYSGEFVPSFVRTLMDMGIQQTYLLITNTGKQIRTTGNHPYLVRSEDLRSRIERKLRLFRARVLLIESNISQKSHDQEQSITNTYLNIEISKINHSWLPLFLNLKAKDNETILNPTLYVNNTAFAVTSFSAVNGVAMANPTQPAAKLTNKSDNIADKAGSNLINNNLSQAGNWVKVSQLKAGMEIATFGDGLPDGASGVVWEKIISIKEFAREQVFDIEVENTHNFVGNDIVAHNTYLNGSTGLGTAFVNTTTPANGLAVSGNVGIGTTTANSNLSVSGNAHIGSLYQGTAAPANGLFVDGNVGIGATTSSNKLDVWGNTRLAGTLIVDSNTTLSSTLGVTGVTTLSSTLSVSGVSTLSANNAALSFTGTTPSLTSGSSVFGIFAGGNVGIGTTGNVYGGLTVRGAGTTTGITLQTYGSGLGQGLTVLDNGNVGIGTTGPIQRLQVNESGTSAFVVTSGGNVGIGFTSPSIGKVHIRYDSQSVDAIYFDDTRSGNQRTWAIGHGTGAGNGFGFYDYTASTRPFFIEDGASSFALYVNSSGNIGIGTTGPGASLSVSSNATIGFGGATSIAGPSNGLGVSGNVGIGTTTANSNLSVAGSAHIGALYQGIAAPANGLFVDGNVGIGATTSSNKLDVWGNSRITGTLTVDSTSTFGGNFTLSSGQFLAPNGTSALPAYSFTNSTSTGMYSPSTNALALNTNGASTPPFTITAAGSVGIGTTSPGRFVEVKKDDAAMGLRTATNANAYAEFSVTQSSGFVNVAANSLGSVALVRHYAGGTLYWDTGLSDSLSPYSQWMLRESGTTPRITVVAGGNVGIGTTSPIANLHVRNTAAQDSFRVDDVLGDTSPFVIASDGNVGISNSAPSYVLDVIGATRFSTNITQGTGQFLAADGTASLPAYSFSGDTDTGLWRIGADQIALTTAGAAMSGLAINSSGNVGIGNTNPSTTLFVNGNAMIGYSSGALGANMSNGLAISGNTGIGVSAPIFSFSTGRFLTVGSNSDTTTGVLELVSSNTGSAGTLGQVEFTNSANSSAGGVEDATGKRVALIEVNMATTGANSDGNSGGTMVFYTKPEGDSLTRRMVILSNGNVGVGGDTTPDNAFSVGSTSQFQVNSSGAIAAVTGITTSGGYTQTGSSANTLSGVLTLSANNAALSFTGTTPSLSTSNGSFSLFPSTGNVGIGTSSVGGSLIVNSGNVGIGFTSPDRLLQIGSDIDIVGSNASLLGAAGSQFSITGGSAAGLQKKLVLGIDTTNNYGVIQAGTLGTNYDLSLNPAGGSVGVGTTSPAQKLEVSGGNIQITGAAPYLFVKSTTGSSPWNDGLYVQSNVDTTGNTPGNYSTFLNPSGKGFTFMQGTTSKMVMDTTGNVGIGFTSPSANLHVVNTAAQNSFRVDDIANDSTPFIIDQNGTILVGSTSFIDAGGQDYKIQVQDTGVNSTDADGGTLFLTSTTTATSANDTGAALVFGGYYTGTTTASWARIRGVKANATDNNYSGEIAFDTRTNGGNFSEKVRITNGGNLGIGFTSPTANLHIVNTAAQDSFRVDDVANDTSPFVINLDGNVGIANSAPSYALDVVGTTRVSSTAVFSGAFTLGDNGETGEINTSDWDISTTGIMTGIGAITADGVLTLSANNAALSFTGTTPSLTSGGSVFGLFAGGNVGIGTTGNIYGGLTVRGAGTSTGITLQTYGSGLGQGLTVLDNGNVGIGTTAPGTSLEVVGGGRVQLASATAASQTVNAAPTATSIAIPTDSSSGYTGTTQHIVMPLLAYGNTASTGTVTLTGLNISQGGMTTNNQGNTSPMTVTALDISGAGNTNRAGVYTWKGVKLTTPTLASQISQTPQANDVRALDVTLGTVDGTSASLQTGLYVTGGTQTTGTQRGIYVNMAAATHQALYIDQGQSLFDDGSSSAPGLSFTADTDTGLWRIGANQIALTTAGAAMSGLAINSSGNVGIGNTSASQLFQINPSGTSAVVVTSGGNVGIGFTSPTSLLHVSSTTAVSDLLNVSSSQAAATDLGAGMAAQFTRANTEFLSIADNTSLSMGDIAMSMSMWVYFDSTANGISFAGKWESGNTEYLLYYVASPARFRFLARNTGNTTQDEVVANTFGAPAANTWYFVTVYHDPTNNLLGISVNDGAFDTRAWTGGIRDSNSAFTLGAQDANGSASHDGRLDSAGVWKKILSAAEITWLYNGGAGRRYNEIGVAGNNGSTLKTSLEAFWELEEASGTRNDSYGSNNLTDNNTVTSNPGVIKNIANLANFSFSPTYTVGAGVTSPSVSAQVLNVSRSVTTGGTFGSTLSVYGALAAISDSAVSGAGTLTHTANVLDITQNYTSSSGTALYVKNYGGASSASFRVDDVSSDATPFIIDSSGNVGIGATNPTGAFQVGSSGAAPPLYITSLTGNIGIGTTGPVQKFQINENSGVQPVVITSTGNVGIGATSPGAQLQIQNSATWSRLNAGDSSFTVSSSKTIKENFNLVSGSGILDKIANVPVYTYDYISGSKDRLGLVAEDFYTVFGRGDGKSINYQEVTMATWLGVQALHDQTTYKGESSEQLEVGDLVSPSATESGQLVKTSTPYDDKVLGVITNDTAPYSTALSGKAQVKVSTENGPIERGDYLTSSSTPGVAMKALRPGQVVGKALEAFECPERPEGVEGPPSTNAQGDTFCSGKIMVFVNVSFADPGNFLASLSMDDQGNLIIPKIRAASIILDQSVASASASLTVGDGQLSLSADPNYTSPGPQLASNSNTYIDLGGKLASLEDRITALEAEVSQQQIATSSAQITFEVSQATSSATPSADLANTSEVDKLGLTPPDILLATGSATLTSLAVSEATVSAMLTAYAAQIQDNFKVFGETTLARTSVAGDLTVDGTLSIENGSELNVIGTLFLQKGVLAQEVDIFNGQVTIDKNGNIQTQGTVLASEVRTNKLTISNTPIASSSATLAASIGTGTIPANQTKVTIPSTNITESSKVFITPTTATDKVLFITNIKNNESFDVSILTPTPVDINFNWWMVQTE